MDEQNQAALLALKERLGVLGVKLDSADLRFLLLYVELIEQQNVELMTALGLALDVLTKVGKQG